MNIDLPENFTMYDERKRNKLAWIEDGILKIKVDYYSIKLLLMSIIGGGESII